MATYASHGLTPLPWRTLLLRLTHADPHTHIQMHTRTVSAVKHVTLVTTNQVAADTKGSMRRVVLSGMTVGGEQGE